MFAHLSSATSNLVPRAQTGMPNGDLVGRLHDELSDRLPTWGSAIFWLTFSFVLLLVIAVRYTLTIVFVLGAVESHDEDYAAPPASSTNIDHPAADSEPYTDDPAAESEPLIREPLLITSGIRTTLRHLQSIGGFKARWRGFSPWIIWIITFSVLNGIIVITFGQIGILSWLIGPMLAEFIIRIALAGLEMAWVHMVISSPSPLPWYRRTNPMRDLPRIWAPTALHSIITQLASTPFSMVSINLDVNIDEGLPPWKWVIYGAVLLLTLIITFVVSVTASAALFRVQASKLPAEENSIVPFRRTFHSLVTSEAQGSEASGLSFGQAWRTINGKTRTRLYKLAVKLIGIAFVVLLLFAGILGLEAFLFSLAA